MLVTLSTRPFLPELMVRRPGPHINSPGILQTSTGGNLSREGAAGEKTQSSDRIHAKMVDFQVEKNRTIETEFCFQLINMARVISDLQPILIIARGAEQYPSHFLFYELVKALGFQQITTVRYTV